MSLSFAPPLAVCFDDHVEPLKVARVLGLPATPLAPTAAQNAVPAHETT